MLLCRMGEQEPNAKSHNSFSRIIRTQEAASFPTIMMMTKVSFTHQIIAMILVVLSQNPTNAQAPTGEPSVSSEPSLSRFPSMKPSEKPSLLPSFQPSSDPSSYPSLLPSELPSFYPSSIPSELPTQSPTCPPERTKMPKKQSKSLMSKSPGGTKSPKSETQSRAPSTRSSGKSIKWLVRPMALLWYEHEVKA